jgi:catechol 2,3-dioxygenase-like lactoylglutathione lyase family enzyme
MKNFEAITTAQVWVLDQQKALDFYVDKLGLEIKADYTQGTFRWLTVGVPGEALPEIALLVPGPPVMDEKTAGQVRELLTKGALGGLVMRTEDCFGLYERLKAKGVEFTQAATEHGYGIDCGIRDPFGNQIRVLQPKKAAKG